MLYVKISFISVYWLSDTYYYKFVNYVLINDKSFNNPVILFFAMLSFKIDEFVIGNLLSKDAKRFN